MEREEKIIFGVTFLMVILLAFAGYKTAHADVVLYSQPSNSQTLTASANSQTFVQRLGTGLSGHVNSIELYLGSYQFYSTVQSPIIVECPTDNFSQCVGIGANYIATYSDVQGYTQTSTSTPVYISFSFNRRNPNGGASTDIQGFDFSSSRYYFIEGISTGGVAPTYSVGITNGGSGIQGCWYNSTNGATTTPCAKTDIFYIISGGDSAISSVSNLSPVTGSTTASIAGHFSWSYTAQNDVAGYFLSLLDLTNGQSNSYLGGVSANTSGSILRKITLISGHAYRWNVVLTDSNGDQVAQTTWSDQYFDVVNAASSTILSTYIPLLEGSSTTYHYDSSGRLIFPTNSTSTTDIQSGIRSFQFLGPIAAAFCTRMPFSYLCDFGTVIDELGSQSAAQTDITVQMPAHTSTTSFKVIDTTKIVAYSNGYIGLIRSIIAYGLWLVWAYGAVMIILRVL